MPNDNSEGDLGAMKSVAEFGTCPTCRRALTQVGPNGECLRCVANWAFLPDNDLSEALCYGHFEVELDENGRPMILGAGGMATTYRARDTTLNSIVALKVIGQSGAANPVARARFLR